jgi:type I restriction enzyme S subunit
MKAFAPEIDAKAPGTTFKEVSGKIVAEIPFPLPPLAEQNRIVSKVDELMGLCDRLEAVTYDAFVAHQLLVEHLLATLTDCKNSEEFAGNWARLEAHFDTLFTTEASVDQLRQTILQLAIMGKLLPQDANDEPASVLLKRVKVRREELVAQGRARKSKQLPRIMSGEMPFSLPKGWEWCRFDDINDPEFAISYGVLVPGADEENGVPFVRIADLSISDPPEYPEKSISSDVDAQYARTRLMGGEILMGVVGSVGKLGVAPQSWAGANIARAICRIVPSKELHHAYALWLLQSQFMQKNFRGDTRTLAQPTLNINLIRSAITPIPPYQEQLRIAGRLDALSSLCDDLKSRFKDANDQKLLLADAIVAKAVA